MIERIEITGVHTDLNDDIKKYVQKKIGKLDRYLPKKHRDDVLAEVKLIEETHKTRKEYTCEVHMNLVHSRVDAKESTLNMFAAVDIVEAKLRNQLKEYKDRHYAPKFHQRMLRKFNAQTRDIS